MRTRFVDAAARVRPAEGGDAGAGRACSRPGSSRLAERYRAEYGVDVTRRSTAPAPPVGSPAGCSPSAAACSPGFELVAEHVDLDERLAAADVVVTGEGYLDAQSLDGKVVGGVCDLAAAAGVPVVVIVGDADPDVARTRRAAATSTVVSLVERFGERRAVRRTALVHRAGRTPGAGVDRAVS